MRLLIQHINKNMAYQKSSDKITKTATWKKPKQVWALRTAKSYLQRLVKEVNIIGNEDVHKLLKCISLLEEVIEKQIKIK